MFKQLKGKYKLCLISNPGSGTTQEERREHIKSLGFNEYFNLIIVTSNRKTIDDFKKCLKKMDIEANECMVIGDRIVSEINLGNQLGMTTVRYRAGKYANVEPENPLQRPDYEIKHLNQLADILYSL